MKLAGCLLLLSGWTIVLVALALLPDLASRAAFIAAGIAVEIFGLGLIARGQVSEQKHVQALKQSMSTLRPGGSRPGGYR